MNIKMVNIYKLKIGMNKEKFLEKIEVSAFDSVAGITGGVFLGSVIIGGIFGYIIGGIFGGAVCFYSSYRKSKKK